MTFGRTNICRQSKPSAALEFASHWLSAPVKLKRLAAANNIPLQTKCKYSFDLWAG